MEGAAVLRAMVCAKLKEVVVVYARLSTRAGRHEHGGDMKIGWEFTITPFPGSPNINFEFVGFVPATE